jgi:hypothetical protein
MSVGFVFHKQCRWLAGKKRLVYITLATLLDMLTFGERSCDHATPRLMLEEIVVSPTSMDSILGVIEEEFQFLHV